MGLSVWGPGLIGPCPGPSEPHHGNWRCGGVVTVQSAGCQTVGPGCKGRKRLFLGGEAKWLPETINH